ncbi:hypothetical protein H6G48_16735 [Microcystis flos-aquae FACHB-1344]|uniref:Uncharacterized protein n=1 Tax=Microcystis flos-aquae FACHB-1344 TaxID=2692899 RepID=A0ABR8HXI7_9CHRO|nr:hypothetical protein [Microcystis flos-aquae FACHB-1344]
MVRYDGFLPSSQSSNFCCYVLLLSGALRRIFTFKSKQQFLLSNAPYVLLLSGALRRIFTFKSKQQFLPSNAPYVLLLS